MRKAAVQLLTVLFSGGSLFVAAPAYAQSICPKGSNFGNLCNLQPTNIGTIVGNAVQIMLILAIVLALFFLILGGIRWITSGGDKGKVDSARGTLTAAIIGLVIALAAFLILNTVTYLVTGQTFTTFTLPTLLQ